MLVMFFEYVHTGQVKILLDRGGNRTRDLWFASPVLCQLSYEVKSVRVCAISLLSLVPSISASFYDINAMFCDVMYLGEDVCW